MARHEMLNNIQHKNLRVVTRPGVQYGDNVGIVMTFPTEYADVQREYPIFVEAYDQIDLSVGYDLSDNFAVSFEAINLTGEDIRWHGRSDKQLWRLEDQGARYAVGARYKF